MFKPTLNYGPKLGSPPSPNGMPSGLAALRPGIGPWVRAAEPSMGAPVGGPQPQPGGTAPPTMGSLRPQPKPPDAGLNEKPAGGGFNDWLTSLLNNMIGGKGMVVSKPKTTPQPAPAAGLNDARADRFDRASRLMGIGAEMMD